MSEELNWLPLAVALYFKSSWGFVFRYYIYRVQYSWLFRVVFDCDLGYWHFEQLSSVCVQVEAIWGQVVVDWGQHSFRISAVEDQRQKDEAKCNGAVDCQSVYFFRVVFVFLLDKRWNEEHSCVNHEVGLPLSDSCKQLRQRSHAPKRYILDLILLHDLNHFFDISRSYGSLFPAVQQFWKGHIYFSCCKNIM